MPGSSKVRIFARTLAPVSDRLPGPWIKAEGIEGAEMDGPQATRRVFVDHVAPRFEGAPRRPEQRLHAPIGFAAALDVTPSEVVHPAHHLGVRCAAHPLAVPVVHAGGS